MKVPAVVIDQAVAERGACLIAKVDVEGHELEVLDGMGYC